MLKRLVVVMVGILFLGFMACNKGINPQIGTVNGDGDTKVDRVDVGTVDGGGTTQVDTVNANIEMGGILGNPYTVVKTSQAVGCPDEQSCKCILTPQRAGILVPPENTFYVAKMNPTRTVFGCIMNSRVIKDASKYNVKIQPTSGAAVAASPIGSAKNLESLNAVVK